MTMNTPDPRPNVQLPLDNEREALIKRALRKYANGIPLDANEKRVVEHALKTHALQDRQSTL